MVSLLPTNFMKLCSVVSEELCWQAASEVYFGKFQVQRGISPTKFRRSKFPGNMHYIWCPYYLPSFMKFCSVVSEELCRQAASEVYFGKFQVQRGITPTTFRGSTLPGNMHNIVFVLSATQFVSATPLKLLNRISWNLVGSKDTICSCAYYQDILIP
jgi:hypothetical protein